MKTEEWRGLPSIHVRLSKELHEIVEREASVMGMKITEFVRYAVVSFLRSINVPVHPTEDQPMLPIDKTMKEKNNARREQQATGDDGEV